MFFSSLYKTLLLLLTANVVAGQLQQFTGNFGNNPTRVGFYYVRPSGLPTNPPLIVAMHYCTGTAQAYFSGTQYANLANTNKFIVIYPNAPDSGGCWDVHTNATLTHDAGGDSLGIANMVRYAIQNWGVDPARVFMTGTSSGAMMTNVLAGSYPDIFRAGAAFAGVPYGCFSGSGMWNNQCANGQLSKTGQQWGDDVRKGYPGYTGQRPALQIWHGTADTTLNYNNFGEAVKQWTNVFGYTTTASQVQQNSPVNGWTRSTYGPNFQAISAQGVPHNIQTQENDVLKWFGIVGGVIGVPGPGTTTTFTPPPTTTTTTTPTLPTTTTTTAPSGPVQTQWGQCGGTGWAGPTTCAPGSTCKKLNDFYSQCQ